MFTESQILLHWKKNTKQTAITLLDLPNFLNFYLAILAFPTEAQVI